MAVTSTMKMRTTFLTILLLSVSVINAQIWQWGKDNAQLIGHTPTDVQIDTRNNTLIFSLTTTGKCISKIDSSGNLIWKRLLVIEPGMLGYTAGFSLDSSGNIYFLTKPIQKIDTTSIAMQGPFCLVKFNTHGRFVWSKPINFTTNQLYISRTAAAGNNIFLSIPYERFTSLSYQGNTFSAEGNNTNTWIAKLDTAGNLIWSKKLWTVQTVSPCGINAPIPEISVNRHQQLLITGNSTDKLVMESDTVVNLNTATCKHFKFAVVLNGNGSLKWGRAISLDTLADEPNHTHWRESAPAAILNNGAVVYYHFEGNYRIINNSTMWHSLLNNLHLFDADGNQLQKLNLGTNPSDFYRIVQLSAGEGNEFVSTGWRDEIVNEALYKKWDAALNVLWAKRPDFNWTDVVMEPWESAYRNNAITTVIQTTDASGSNYVYFSADSIYPHYKLMIGRLVDSANSISGIAFFDLNKNGLREPSEPAAQHLLVGNMTGDTIYTATRTNGIYQFIPPPGNYNYKLFNIQALYPNYTNVVPASHQAQVQGYGNNFRNKNFALQSSVTLSDGSINISSYNTARPGFFFWVKSEIKNTGTVNASGNYYMKYDSSILQYMGSTIQPVSHSGNMLGYAYNTMPPFSTLNNNISFRVKTNAVQGDTLRIEGTLITNPADMNLGDNVDTISTIIKGSWDPNDKQVLPHRELIYDSVVAQKREIDYTIRFQNTGTDTAFSITIADTLDSKLNINTFRLVSSSHNLQVNWKNPRTLEFYFPDIRLPDSNVNELASHGFVRFKIKPQPTILITDVVRNSASIYFDYNAPVKTNTVTTIFVNNIITGLPSIPSDTQYLHVQPNPANHTLFYKLTKNNVYEMAWENIYDVSGKRVRMERIRLNGGMYNSIDVSKLPAGVYFLELKNEKRRYARMFVRTR